MRVELYKELSTGFLEFINKLEFWQSTSDKYRDKV